MMNELLDLFQVPFLAPIAHASLQTVFVRRIVVMHDPCEVIILKSIDYDYYFEIKYPTKCIK